MTADRYSEDPRARRPRDGTLALTLLALALIALLVLAGIVLVSVADGTDQGRIDLGVSIADITNDPEAYYDERVTVSGPVDQMLGTRAVTIGGEGFAGGVLLIVSMDDLPVTPGRTAEMPVVPGDVVQTTGIVRPFDVTQIGEEIGVELPSSVFGAWEGKPVVVVEWLHITPRSGGAAPASTQPG